MEQEPEAWWHCEGGLLQVTPAHGSVPLHTPVEEHLSLTVEESKSLQVLPVLME